MELKFAYPLFLAALLLMPLLWLLLGRMVGRRQRLMRVFLLITLILALARPLLLLPNSSKARQVFVLDRTASLSELQWRNGEDVLDDLLRHIPIGDDVTLIIVGDDQGVLTIKSNASKNVLERTLVVRLATAGSSPLSEALQLAEQEIPEFHAGTVTLISDGLSTNRRWGPALQALIDRAIPVHTYNLGSQPGDVYPSRIHVDSGTRVGQSTEVMVDVIGSASEIQVRLSDANGELARSAPTSSDGRVTIPLLIEPKAAGFLTLTAEVVVAIEGEDVESGNNRVTETVAIQDPIRVLYVSGRQGAGAEKLQELLGLGYMVIASGETQVINTLEEGSYDLVFLDGIPTWRLSDKTQEHLVEAVSIRGLGLIFSGGKASFTSGAYRQAKLASILPVELDQQEEKQDPSVALALIIDTSGSMAGIRLELAKQFARTAMGNLKPEDWIGVLEYHGAKRWAVPMMPASNKVSVARIISRMSQGGGNWLQPVLVEAHHGLNNTPARIKHILLITDGGNEVADFESSVRRLAKDNITLSTVCVGNPGIDQNLLNMSIWGKGRYFAVRNRFDLIDFDFKMESTDQLSTYHRGNFSINAGGGAGWWGDVDKKKLPAIHGYAEVTPRTGAEVLIAESRDGHPVLATWLYGLGRVTSLMSEPMGEGTTPWLGWTDYGAFLGQIVAHTILDRSIFKYKIARDQDKVHITAHRNSQAAEIRPVAMVLQEDVNGSVREIPSIPLKFVQLTPDRFEATFSVGPEETARIVAGIEGKTRGNLQRLVSSAFDGNSPERQVDPLLGLDLTRLSQATGGNVLGAASTIIAGDGSKGRQPTLIAFKVWPYILFLALLTYLCELVYRRWPTHSQFR